MSEDLEDQAVYEVDVDVTAVLGTASLLVNQLLIEITVLWIWVLKQCKKQTILELKVA